MSAPEQPNLPAKGQFLVYQAEDGQVKIDVRLHGETAWLTQAHMAELFQTTVPNISMHLRNIYAEGELQPEATIQEFLIVRPEGSRQVSRSVEHYNLAPVPGLIFLCFTEVRFATQRAKLSSPSPLGGERAGFVNRGGKGSHRNFTHPKPLRVTVSGHPGDDAKHYQERDVRRALDAVKH